MIKGLTLQAMDLRIHGLGSEKLMTVVAIEDDEGKKCVTGISLPTSLQLKQDPNTETGKQKRKSSI